MKYIRPALALSLLSLLVACGASPPARYYTLQAPPAATPIKGDAGFMVEVLPVAVTPQADQPQIMLRTGTGSIAPLYSDRWSAPLGDELRSALVDGLTRDLGALDAGVLRPPLGTPLWRVQTDVQRFDMSDKGPTVLDVTWRVRPVSLKGGALLCRTVVTMPVGAEDVASLVTAQQQAVALLARTIASGIRHGGQRADAAGPEVHIPVCTVLADESR
ncbi:PqiC family protein [Bordetella avium]|uniref:Lipoprotein n=1 Tax=Bordetella avium (strain 197N) TaxID=360910 RepID=Q2KZJ1_BORA1|nr:PqiC family protein [Bordetella avium]AZY49402.1 hypothetical protein C0J09_09800 [Bordetella avium]AZY52755.1 hypothetical protein C0J07_09785 [Bordetella avium]RIQ12097.1 membrane integrity-associated transporter subunit PqiC [Bordetella avium]RIQ19084.1 membrane integrity-associated transporter subunit PqiC [Bordetella avium]RIQ31994.1 membrane integrity-associated transporter subunit PqiC [Bordetella avium]